MRPSPTPQSHPPSLPHLQPSWGFVRPIDARTRLCLLLQRQVPHVLSLTDFIGWRYGWVAKSYVVLLCLFNMSIGEWAGS